jgi:hypothetical protein
MDPSLASSGDHPCCVTAWTLRNGGQRVVDHRTPFQKLWATVAGVVLLVGGVLLAGIFYGDVALTVAGGVIAVIGFGLLRYALMRRRRAARG